MYVLTNSQMKEAERIANDSGVSYYQLMENAGRKAFNLVSANNDISNKRCTIFCGKGNNGGDGFVFARLAAKTGCKTTVVLSNGVPTTEEAKRAFSNMENVKVIKKPTSLILDYYAENSDFLVDAVFGTGFSGSFDIKMENISKYYNDSKAYKIALDIPSGINSDTTACVPNYLKSDETIVFAAIKQAHIPLKKLMGKMSIVDIGISEDIIKSVGSRIIGECEGGCEDKSINKFKMLDSTSTPYTLPMRIKNSNKGTYGKLLNICGSQGMCGAAMMSTLSAMRAGAGTTTLASEKAVIEIVAPHLMEAMTAVIEQENDIDVALEGKTACLIGCGLGRSGKSRKLVEYVMKNADCSLVIDADGLNCITRGMLSVGVGVGKKDIIITPHVGEMARLCDISIPQVKENPTKIASDFAVNYNVTVVLKDNITHIALPNGEVILQEGGNAGLAKGGSGDVLAGIIAGLLAQGFSPEIASTCGVFILGCCAEKLAESMSLYSILARDLIDTIPLVMKKLEM